MDSSGLATGAGASGRAPAARVQLRFVRPCLPPPAAWVPFLEPAYASRQFTNRGAVLVDFERRLGAALAPAEREAAVVCSATAGITAALQALGVAGPVACPAFTFSASAHAIRQAGCEPWLCDVDPHTWELSAASIAPALRAGARAIRHVRTLKRSFSWRWPAGSAACVSRGQS